MNSTLKAAILDAGVRQYELAREIGITETLLSRIVTGRHPATEHIKRALAQRLGKSVRVLFANSKGEAT